MKSLRKVVDKIFSHIQLHEGKTIPQALKDQLIKLIDAEASRVKTKQRILIEPSDKNYIAIFQAARSYGFISHNFRVCIDIIVDKDAQVALDEVTGDITNTFKYTYEKVPYYPEDSIAKAAICILANLNVNAEYSSKYKFDLIQYMSRAVNSSQSQSSITFTPRVIKSIINKKIPADFRLTLHSDGRIEVIGGIPPVEVEMAPPPPPPPPVIEPPKLEDISKLIELASQMLSIEAKIKKTKQLESLIAALLSTIQIIKLYEQVVLTHQTSSTSASSSTSDSPIKFDDVVRSVVDLTEMVATLPSLVGNSRLTSALKSMQTAQEKVVQYKQNLSLPEQAPADTPRAPVIATTASTSSSSSSSSTSANSSRDWLENLNQGAEDFLTALPTARSTRTLVLSPSSKRYDLSLMAATLAQPEDETLASKDFVVPTSPRRRHKLMK